MRQNEFYARNYSVLISAIFQKFSNSHMMCILRIVEISRITLSFLLFFLKCISSKIIIILWKDEVYVLRRILIKVAAVAKFLLGSMHVSINLTWGRQSMSKQTGISRNIFANVLIPYRTLIEGSGYTRRIPETYSTLF